MSHCPSAKELLPQAGALGSPGTREPFLGCQVPRGCSHTGVTASHGIGVRNQWDQQQQHRGGTRLSRTGQVAPWPPGLPAGTRTWHQRRARAPPAREHPSAFSLQVGFFFGGGHREADNFLMGSVAPIQPVRLAASPGHTNPVPTNPPRLGLVGKEPEGQRQTASKVPRWHLPALCPPL